jgi:hypothetical protein
MNVGGRPRRLERGEEEVNTKGTKQTKARLACGQLMHDPQGVNRSERREHKEPSKEGSMRSLRSLRLKKVSGGSRRVARVVQTQGI